MKERYQKEIAPAPSCNRHRKCHADTGITKVVVNIGVGEALITLRLEALFDLTNHRSKTIITKAKKSIANFKLREGRQIGVKSTLRVSGWVILRPIDMLPSHVCVTSAVSRPMPRWSQ
jgi:large subunit ribosomal protein L5